MKMPDREEVIKALENCSFDYGHEFECLTCYSFNTTGEKMCPYKYPNNCLEGLIKDALAMLKEQENASKRNPVIVCPHCGKRVK